MADDQPAPPGAAVAGDVASQTGSTPEHDISEE